MTPQGELQLNSSMRCAKYMLIIVSAMFAITAILLVMVGTTIQTIFGDFSEFIDDHLWSPPALIIAIGFIMLIVSSLGIYGAIKESVLLINLFGFFLFLVFILEVAAAITAFAMRIQVGSMLKENMMNTFSYYNDTYYANASVDFVQSGLECCGVDGPADWASFWQPNKTESNYDEMDIFVPQSCCGSFDESTMKCELQFESGCYPRLNFIIQQSVLLIATGATTVAFVQLLGVLCAFMLAKTLRRNKSIREARRWQLQQSLSVLISDNKVMPPPNSPFTSYTQLQQNGQTEQGPITYTPASPSVN